MTTHVECFDQHVLVCTWAITLIAVIFLLHYRKSRYTINTNETSKQFGPVEIHFGKVNTLIVY